MDAIKAKLVEKGWFQQPGAYVLVDGQYGSTGKGALAALLAKHFYDEVNIVTTNAGPNSGHTGFVQVGGKVKKVLTQQIPVFAVMGRALGADTIAYLNGGAVINPEILQKEATEYGITRPYLSIHPNAAIIDSENLTDGAESTAKIASTNKGVGRAIARKVMRETNVAKSWSLGPDVVVENIRWNWQGDVVFVETAQGFSLGINQPFYPCTTSRECTVQQAIADANIPYNKVRKVVMSVRTFPIRVGNTAVGYSGDCYLDQAETTWAKLGVPEELTTVTKRVRRVFTWSDQQFCDALEANQPDVIFATFLDYLQPDDQGRFIDRLHNRYEEVMGREPDAIIGAYGPLPSDCRLEA